MAPPAATTGSTVSRVAAAISSMATTLVGSDMATVRAPSTRDSGSTSCLRARCAGTRATISALTACWRMSTEGSPCSLESSSTSRSSVTRPRRASTAPSRSLDRRCSRSASWAATPRRALVGIHLLDALGGLHEALDVAEPRVDLAERLQHRQVRRVLRERRLEHLGAVAKLALFAGIMWAAAGSHSVLPPG